MRSRRLQDLQPRRPVARLQRAIAEIAQHLDDKLAHRSLVLDHQHGLAGLRRGAAVGRGRGGRVSSTAPR